MRCITKTKATHADSSFHASLCSSTILLWGCQANLVYSVVRAETYTHPSQLRQLVAARKCSSEADCTVGLAITGAMHQQHMGCDKE